MISIQRLFPWLAIGISLMAWYDPTPLMGLQDAIIPLLSMIMFCMGLVLRVADFQRVARKPKPIFLGVALQFLLMPLLAWFIGVALQLPPELAVGLIVVGACAGGTASNAMTFLAGGDVALSVSMTLTSTSPPARKVITFEAVPPAQAPTTINPTASSGGSCRATPINQASNGINKNCKATPKKIGLGLRATR